MCVLLFCYVVKMSVASCSFISCAVSSLNPAFFGGDILHLPSSIRQNQEHRASSYRSIDPTTTAMDRKHWNYRIFLYIFFLYFSHISGNELNSLKFLFFGDWGLPGENLTEVVGTMPQLKDTSFLIALGRLPSF